MDITIDDPVSNINWPNANQLLSTGNFVRPSYNPGYCPEAQLGVQLISATNLDGSTMLGLYTEVINQDNDESLIAPFVIEI